MSRAFVFPGQGAQSIGMGKSLADAYPAAKAVFDEVDEALGEKLSSLIWDGQQDELTLTQNAQPALMATSLAAVKALEAEGVGMDAAAFVAGHSLGEYSALAAAGTLSIADTARLLRIRGKAMQEAVPVGVGAMAALLGLDFETARAVAEEAVRLAPRHHGEQRHAHRVRHLDLRRCGNRLGLSSSRRAGDRGEREGEKSESEHEPSYRRRPPARQDP